MIPFERLLNNSRHVPIIDEQCEQIKADYRVDDVRSSVIPAGDVFVFQQATAHNALDSVITHDENGVATASNRYDYDDNDQGVHPERIDSPLYDPASKKLRMSDAGLPKLVFGDASKIIEMGADAHRVNENANLKAIHLMVARIYNRRIDEHGDPELAKQEATSLNNYAVLDATKRVTGFETEQILNVPRKLKNLFRSLEWNFQLARGAHSQVPENVSDIHVFEKRASASVDIMAMFDGSSMARDLNLGVSEAMTKMTHVQGEHNIIERTIGRHNEFRLAPWGELARLLGMDTPSELENKPLWYGLLKEAELAGTGRLGPIGAIAVAAGIGGSLMWGRERAQGLWQPRWPKAPSTSIEIAEYSLGG